MQHPEYHNQKGSNGEGPPSQKSIMYISVCREMTIPIILLYRTFLNKEIDTFSVLPKAFIHYLQKCWSVRHQCLTFCFAIIIKKKLYYNKYVFEWKYQMRFLLMVKMLCFFYNNGISVFSTKTYVDCYSRTIKLLYKQNIVTIQNKTCEK